MNMNIYSAIWHLLTAEPWLTLYAYKMSILSVLIAPGS